jgi:hypothetical protein
MKRHHVSPARISTKHFFFRETSMSIRKTFGFSIALSVLALVATSPASAERMCYPYPDGGPGGYNKLTHQCNGMNIHELPVVSVKGQKAVPVTGGVHGTTNTTVSNKVGPATPK